MVNGRENLVCGLEVVWMFSWIRERGWEFRRIKGERIDEIVWERDFDWGPFTFGGWRGWMGYSGELGS